MVCLCRKSTSTGKFSRKPKNKKGPLSSVHKSWRLSAFGALLQNSGRHRLEGHLSGHGGKGSGQPGVSEPFPHPSDPLAVCGGWTAAEGTLSGLWDLVPAFRPHLEAGLGVCFGPINLSDRAGHKKNHGSEDGVS